MRTALLALCAVPAFFFGFAATASAHAILMDSQPAAAATVAAGSTAITLRFNSRIDQARSRLELRGADGAAQVLPLSAAPVDRLQATAPLAPGSWTLRWQVLAVDGHITRGDVPFIVKAP